MKRFIFIGVLTVLCGIINAQTYINNDTVSGTWTKALSPYIINNDILIPSDSLLVIESGVKVKFAGTFKLTVDGNIKAIGTKTDSIYFTSLNSEIRWNGIEINNTNSNSLESIIEYGVIEYAGDTISDGYGHGYSYDYGFTIKNGSLFLTGYAPIKILNSIIRNNKACNAGAIYLNNSKVKLINTKIENNEGLSTLYLDKSASL